MSLPADLLSAEHRNRPARCAIYTRQSRKTESAFSSCEAQEMICRDMAVARSWMVTAVFHDEGASSETLNRPALQQVLAAAEAGEFQQLLIYSVDRLTRRLLDLHRLMEMLDRFDVTLTVVTDSNFGQSAASRLVTNIIAAASEFQQEITGERLRDSRAALKKKGRRVAGRVAMGYRANPVTKQLEMDADQAETIRSIFDLAAQGRRPREIAELANKQRWEDEKGNVGAWTARRIQKMLVNPIYAGRIRNGADTLPGQHPAIVSRDEYEAVREILRSRRTRDPSRREPMTWRGSLKGKLICASCDRPMSPSISGYRNFRYQYYRCRSHAGGRPPCPGTGISTFELEEFVRETLGSNVPDSQTIQVESACAFTIAWKTLDADRQRRLLPEVITRVRLDIASGNVSIDLVQDAFQLLQRDEAADSN